MTHKTAERRTTVDPPEGAERRHLARLADLLDTADDDSPPRLAVGDRELPLPGSAQRVLRLALEEFASGAVVAVEPLRRELSTQEASDLLGVSRPYLVKLLETGVMPYYKVGPRRRVRLEDVLAYRETRMQERRDALRELSRLSQRLELDP